MKKLLLFILILFMLPANFCFAENFPMRSYDSMTLAQGTFIPVISEAEISTQYCDVNSVVKFMGTNDLYLYNTNVLPMNTEFTGYIEKICEPVIGTNASMIIKITKAKLPDGYEIPVRGYIYTPNGNLIGGELTEPANYIKIPSYRLGQHDVTGYVPGSQRRMGEHTVLAAGANLMIVLVAPLPVTHTVTN